MLFFAWSLVLSAVNYARRQRLTNILERHLFTPCAYQTGIICKKIPKKIFGNFLAVEVDSGLGSSSSFSNGSASNSLVRAPSEPVLCQERSSVVLYRTEELEILAVPKPEPLQITDWTLFTDEIKKSIFIPQNSPRISFIAVITVNQNYTGSQDDLNKLFTSDYKKKTGTEEESEEQLEADSLSGVSPVLISSVANQIAFRRYKPNEVLYETDLNNFYSVVFQWSESALFEFSGRGIVKEIYTVQLPDLVQKPENVAQILPYASAGSLTLPSSLRSCSQRKPYTLLEYLYLKDLFGDIMDNSNEWKRLNVVNVRMNEYSYYRSDSALNRAISPSGSICGSTRRRPQRALLAANPPPSRSSSAQRSASPDTASEPHVPAYIRELRKQNDTKLDRRRTCSLNSSSSKSETTHCSPSVTIDDMMEDIKFIDYSSIEEESTTSSTTPRESPKQQSFTEDCPSTARSTTNKIQKELESFIVSQGVPKKSSQRPAAGIRPCPNKISPTTSIPTPETQFTSHSAHPKPIQNGDHKRRFSTNLKFHKMTESLSKRFHLNVDFYNPGVGFLFIFSFLAA